MSCCGQRRSILTVRQPVAIIAVGAWFADSTAIRAMSPGDSHRRRFIDDPLRWTISNPASIRMRKCVAIENGT